MRAPGAAVPGLLEIPGASPGARAVVSCTRRRVSRSGFFASPRLSAVVSSRVLPCSPPASARPALLPGPGHHLEQLVQRCPGTAGGAGSWQGRRTVPAPQRPAGRERLGKLCCWGGGGQRRLTDRAEALPKPADHK